MGTSKGYIPPTSIPWKNAKHAVSALRKNPNSSELRQNAIAYYANARRNSFPSTTGGGTKAARAISNLSGFLSASKNGTINTYLREIGRTDLLGKSTAEIFQILLYDFTDNSTTTEDRNLCYVITKVLDNLEIKVEEDFSHIAPEAFLLEFLAEYICGDFDFCFEEQLRKNVSTTEFDTIINNIHEFIRTTVYTQRDRINEKKLNYHYLRNESFVQRLITDTYDLFCSLHTEEV